MAKTTVRGAQIADGANGVDLTVDVTGILPITNGGTGASSATAALTSLGAAADSAVIHNTGDESFGGVKTLLNRFEVADGDGHPKVVLQPSTAGHSGYVDFYDSDGTTRAGYMGYANSTTLNLYAVSGRGYDFNGGNDPTVGGKTIWHAGSAYITVGTQSGGGVGLLRLEDATAARASWTVTGLRRWSAGNNGTSWTLRDESGGVNALTVSAGGNAAFSGNLTMNGLDVGYRNVPTTTSNASYTFVAEDVGKARMHTDSTARTYTVPSSTFSTGDVLTVVNTGTANVTLAQGSGMTLTLAGTTTTGSRTVARNGVATIFFTSASAALVAGSGVT